MRSASNLHSFIGERFGALQVQGLEFVASARRNHFRCVCDCGNQRLVAPSNLRNTTRSCGCLSHTPEVNARRASSARATRLKSARKLVASDDPSVMLVPLNDGTFSVIDATDYLLVSGRSWHVATCRNRHETGVAYGYSQGRGKPQRTVLLHRLLMQPPSDLVVDHIDGDIRNNRRSNLRVCTNAQNLMNKHVTPNRKRGSFKGVKFDGRRWSAAIKASCVVHYLGLFPSEKEAALAYDCAARRLHGEFANLNFPEELSK